MIQSPGKLLGLSFMFAGIDSYDVGNQIGTDLINVHFKGIWLGDSTPRVMAMTRCMNRVMLRTTIIRVRMIKF